MPSARRLAKLEISLSREVPCTLRPRLSNNSAKYAPSWPDAPRINAVSARGFMKGPQRMFRRKLAPDLIQGGHRFADKNMRQSITLLYIAGASAAGREVPARGCRRLRKRALCG